MKPGRGAWAQGRGLWLCSQVTYQFPRCGSPWCWKINLAEDMLAYSGNTRLRRPPAAAFTLSHLQSHRDGQRSDIMDVAGGEAPTPIRPGLAGPHQASLGGGTE